MKTVSFIYEDTETGEKLVESFNQKDVDDNNQTVIERIHTFLDVVESKMTNKEVLN